MDFLDKLRSRAERRRRGSYLGDRIGKRLCELQHDQNIANSDGATVRADINNALGALFSVSSGSSAPTTTIAYQFWADTGTGVLKQRNAANTGWVVRGSLTETFVTSRSTNTILAAGDVGKAFRATAGFTQTFTAAATLADGWYCFYRIESGATIIFDPNSTETIDGATTKTVTGPAGGIIFCSGSAFHTFGLDLVPASDTTPGAIQIALQADQETASSTTLAVTPGRQKYHPSAVKAWVHTDTAAGIQSSYNVSSITDIGAGQAGVNYSTAFSSARGYTCWGCVEFSGPLIFVANSVGTISASRRDFISSNTASAAQDPSYWHMGFAGDQ